MPSGSGSMSRSFRSASRKLTKSATRCWRWSGSRRSTITWDVSLRIQGSHHLDAARRIRIPDWCSPLIGRSGLRSRQSDASTPISARIRDIAQERPWERAACWLDPRRTVEALQAYIDDQRVSVSLMSTVVSPCSRPATEELPDQRSGSQSIGGVAHRRSEMSAITMIR